MNVLYISYDGITDMVSGSQIMPYLTGLAKRGHVITFLSFEKKNEYDGEYAIRRKMLEDSGIRWVRKRYHKRPAIPATLYDILQGVAAGITMLKGGKIEIIHARGYISACIGFILKCIFKIKFMFDMRGFWPEEKVDAGNWRERAATYRIFKRLEKIFISEADAVVVLTQSAKDHILENNPGGADITVIPCCVDTCLFSANSFCRAGPGGRRIVLYVGNLGSFYNLDEVLNFFIFLREMDKSFFLRIISGYKKEDIGKETALKNIDMGDYSVEKLARADMPAAFSQAEFSVIFYNRKRSGKGCCPIKLGESLSSGVPVVINSGIGDCDKIVTENRVGVLIKDFSRSEYARAFTAMKDLREEGDVLSQRCVEVATKLFALETGIEGYEGVYKSLAR